MKPSVYIETSVIGYLTSWPRQDIIVAGHQNTTKRWWATATKRFELFVSQLVVHECSGGDSDAAKDRLECIDGIPVLPISTDAEDLAEALLQAKVVPESQTNDALHIAMAATHRVQYLISWNFRHIVNASLRPAVERICHDSGFDPPVICTPEELLEDNDD